MHSHLYPRIACSACHPHLGRRLDKCSCLPCSCCRTGYPAPSPALRQHASSAGKRWRLRCRSARRSTKEQRGTCTSFAVANGRALTRYGFLDPLHALFAVLLGLSRASVSCLPRNAVLITCCMRHLYHALQSGGWRVLRCQTGFESGTGGQSKTDTQTAASAVEEAEAALASFAFGAADDWGTAEDASEQDAADEYVGLCLLGPVFVCHGNRAWEKDVRHKSFSSVSPPPPLLSFAAFHAQPFRAAAGKARQQPCCSRNEEARELYYR